MAEGCARRTLADCEAVIAEEYTVGASPLPHWLRGRLLPFKKMDGSVGYEYRGAVRIYDLDIGDTLIRYGGQVYVNKQRRDD